MVIYWEQLPRYPPKNFHHFPPKKLCSPVRDCTYATQLGRRCSRKTWVTKTQGTPPFDPCRTPKMLPMGMGESLPSRHLPLESGGGAMNFTVLKRRKACFIPFKKKAEARMTGHLRIHGCSLQGKQGLHKQTSLKPCVLRGPWNPTSHSPKSIRPSSLLSLGEPNDSGVINHPTKRRASSPPTQKKTNEIYI